MIRFPMMTTLTTICLVLASDPSVVARGQSTSPTVGEMGSLDAVVLPGSELVAKPIDEREPMIVRVTDVFPHGDAFRYDLQFQGLEPGTYDLTDWLVRKDGSSTGELPAVEVEIRSVLPPGQVLPNEVEVGGVPLFGGYTRIALVVGVLWLIGLAVLLAPRKRAAAGKETAAPPQTLAELLHDRITAARQGQAASTEFAELERMLLSWWRQRLGLESMPLAQASQRIREDETAGPLLVRLERWIHRPPSDRESIDLESLLEPYRDLPAQAWDPAGSDAQKETSA